MRRDAGFTLLEVMVAFTIAALATAVLLRAGFTGAAADAQASRVQNAVARAQSRLASIGPLTPLQAGTASGDDGGGYRWRLTISPVAANGNLTLYAVTVVESFGSRQVVLTTERTGLKAGP